MVSELSGAATSVPWRVAVSSGVVAVAMAMAFMLLPPDGERIRGQALEPPFAHRGGAAWVASVPVMGDAAQSPAASRMELLEDGAPLGPGRALHDDIATLGGGRFSHWEGSVIFSSSDGSDPNTNGKRYRWRLPVPLVPPWVHWTILCVGAAALFACLLIVGERLWRRASMPVALAIFGAVLVEGGSAMLLAQATRGADPQQKALLDRLTGRGATIETKEGEALNYRPHPYIGFTLNPEASYGGARQFDAELLIRRSVPPRPRREVPLRILAIGGSSTFGAGVMREEDTWVHRLEADLRKRIDPAVEVINGGVGGYNIIENQMHYQLLLGQLDPDLVLLVTGVNDVHPRLIGELRPDYSNARIVWSGDGLDLRPPPAWLSWSNLRRLLLWQRIREGATGHIYAVVQRPYPPVEQWPAQLHRNDASVYRRHLETFVRLLQAEGRRVVLVPQLWLSRPGHPEDAAFEIGVREHNDIGRAVAESFGVPFVADAIAEPMRRPSLLWDAMHFNEEGSRAMAELLAQWLCVHPEILTPWQCR